MKTAVSIPDDVFAAAERVAERLGWSRSELYARALERFVAEQGDDEVTERLNEIADELESADGASLGRDLIERGAWEW